MATWKFSPGRMSRLEIQHLKPRLSSALHSVNATFRSWPAKLMKMFALIATFRKAREAGRETLGSDERT